MRRSPHRLAASSHAQGIVGLNAAVTITGAGGTRGGAAHGIDGQRGARTVEMGTTAVGGRVAGVAQAEAAAQPAGADNVAVETVTALRPGAAGGAGVEVGGTGSWWRGGGW
jgi:hypothetical protein